MSYFYLPGAPFVFPIRMNRSRRRRTSRIQSLLQRAGGSLSNAKFRRLRWHQYTSGFFWQITAASLLLQMLLQSAMADEPFVLQGECASIGLPTAMVAADFNGDGFDDLAVASQFETSIDVFLGFGNGAFLPTTTPLPVGGFPAPVQMATGDINGDGIVDLAAQDSSAGSRIFLGNGDGTFTDTGFFTGLTLGVVLCDLNGDGLDDLLALRGFASPNPENVSILLSDGEGSFVESQTLQPEVYVDRATLGDFDGDGIMDIALSFEGLLNPGIPVYLGLGDGTFSGPQFFEGGFSPGAIESADYNGDGFLDLVTRESSTISEVGVLLGNGDGTFQPRQVISSTNGQSDGMVSADFNGDNIADLALVRCENSAGCVLTFTKDDTFSEFTQLQFKFHSFSEIATADFNSDGVPDLAVSTSDSVVFFLSSCNGAALPGDINRDGVIDLLDVDPFVDLLANLGFSTEADINNDGNVDLLDIGPFVHLLSS